MAVNYATAGQIRLGRGRTGISTLPSALMKYCGHQSYLQGLQKQENA